MMNGIEFDENYLPEWYFESDHKVKWMKSQKID